MVICAPSFVEDTRMLILPTRFMQTLRRVLAVAGTAMFVIGPAAAQAQQGARVGVIAGANFATLRGLDDVDLDKRTGAMGGLSLLLPLGSSWALQPEALVVTAGAEPSTAPGNGLSLTYAQIPLLLRLSPAAGSPIAPHLYAGPYVGLQIRCRVDVGGVDGSCDDVPGVNTESVDLGGIVGGGLDVNLGGLVLTGGVRYGFGVSKIAAFELDSVRESAKNGSFAVYAGLAVRFGK
jgi:hypothetical protein